jgi:rubrerythrin
MSAQGYARDLAALRGDLEFEIAAVKRYGRMAEEAGDPALRALFKELSIGETGHWRGLRRTIATIEDTATPVVLF